MKFHKQYYNSLLSFQKARIKNSYEFKKINGKYKSYFFQNLKNHKKCLTELAPISAEFERYEDKMKSEKVSW